MALGPGLSREPDPETRASFRASRDGVDAADGPNLRLDLYRSIWIFRGVAGPAAAIEVPDPNHHSHH